MTTDIDAIIAEATQDVATQSEPSKTTEVTEIEQSGDQAEEKDLSQKTDEELTPEQLTKRERNRESKLSKKLAEFKKQNRALQEQLAQREAPKLQNLNGRDPSTKPNPNDPFYKDKTWEQYNEDLTDWKLDNKLSENTRKAQESQQRENYTHWVEERSNKVDERLPELSAKIPDIGEVLADVEDLAQLLTPEQARVALEAEDINLAVYTLYKEGKLELAMKLPPSQLAAFLAKAEIRGQQYLAEPKQTTNAPRPMNAAKGNTTGGKSLEKQSVDELMSSYGFR